MHHILLTFVNRYYNERTMLSKMSTIAMSTTTSTPNNNNGGWDICSFEQYLIENRSQTYYEFLQEEEEISASSRNTFKEIVDKLDDKFKCYMFDFSKETTLKNMMETMLNMAETISYWMFKDTPYKFYMYLDMFLEKISNNTTERTPDRNYILDLSYISYPLSRIAALLEIQHLDYKYFKNEETFVNRFKELESGYFSKKPQFFLSSENENWEKFSKLKNFQLFLKINNSNKLNMMDTHSFFLLEQLRVDQFAEFQKVCNKNNIDYVSEKSFMDVLEFISFWDFKEPPYEFYMLLEKVFIQGQYPSGLEKPDAFIGKLIRKIMTHWEEHHNIEEFKQNYPVFQYSNGIFIDIIYFFNDFTPWCWKEFPSKYNLKNCEKYTMEHQDIFDEYAESCVRRLTKKDYFGWNDYEKYECIFVQENEWRKQRMNGRF